MKETISLFIFFALYSLTCNAQEKDKAYQTFSVYSNYTDALNIGISFEIRSYGTDIWGICKEKNHFLSWVNNISATSINLNIDDAPNTIKGYGFQFDTGLTAFLKAEKKYGLYIEYFIFNGGKCYFDETIHYADGTEKKIKGTYSYISVLNPGIGYKIEITKNFNINFNTGIFWRGMSEKTNGDLEKDMFRDFMPRFGFKAGWLF